MHTRASDMNSVSRIVAAALLLLSGTDALVLRGIGTRAFTRARAVASAERSITPVRVSSKQSAVKHSTSLIEAFYGPGQLGLVHMRVPGPFYVTSAVYKRGFERRLVRSAWDWLGIWRLILG